MNQILNIEREIQQYYNKPSKVKTAQISIKKAVIIYCILLILFSSFLIGKNTYAIIMKKEKREDKIVVKIDKMGKEAVINVSANKPIKSIKYKWNDGEENDLNVIDKDKFETVVEIPNGNNLLNLIVTDYYNNEKLYQRQYIYESADIKKPIIKLEKAGRKLRILASDETEIKYITYSWNQGEEKKIEVGTNKKEMKEEIEVPEGRNTLKVKAVDKEENREILETIIVGAKKPVIELTTEEDKLVIKVTDNEGLDKLLVTIDGKVYETKANLKNKKEETVYIKLEKGRHTIYAEIININGLSANKNLVASM